MVLTNTATHCRETKQSERRRHTERIQSVRRGEKI